jgi:CubicO group peptidase (beta-lactamase class C family)
MKRSFLFSLLALSIITAFSQKNVEGKNAVLSNYFPSAQNWEKRSARSSGFDTAKLNQAIRFAIENESKTPRNMQLSQTMTFGNEPFSNGIGPFTDRGDPGGIIIYKGYIVAEWGEPGRPDMTNSVTKSFLSAVVGLAVDQGLIHSVNDTVADYVPPVEVFDPRSGYPDVGTKASHQLLYPFATEHNRQLTWNVMLRQTSDWEGTLWDKPDWADRPPDSYHDDPGKWISRKRNEPGAVWTYNDVRVNALALATTLVWRKPLPQVLKTYIMDPIGASNTWRWYGYRNSWIVLDGMPVQSVSGGGHWGGGMFINTYDMARFGLLTLHGGKWNGKQLISEKWIKQSLTPTTANPSYGYMNFFLNTNKKYLPDAPASSFVHVGNGANIIYVDPEHDLVMVVRWIENNAVDSMVKKVLGALK